MEQKRKKLGGTPMSTLKDSESEISSKVGRRNDRAGFLSVDKGWNKFRLYPAHPGTESFMYASVKYFLPQEGDDGKLIKKAVFNSKVHGNTEKDIVEEFIKFSHEHTFSHLEGPALEEALKPIMAYKAEFQLSPSIEWVSYADKYKKDGKKIGFGRFSVTNGTKNKMEGLTATEQSDQPIILDPYTDEEDGIALILNYDPDAKDKRGKKDFKNFYNVELEQKQVTKFRIELIPTPLIEKDVEAFLKVETLESMYKNCYTVKDFNLALTGLQIIDHECKFGIFDDPEWLEIVEEIKTYYPEEGEEKEEIDEVKTNVDDLINLDRTELKRLILKDYGQGVIVIKKNYTDDQIRELIREKRKEVQEVEEEESLEILEVDDGLPEGDPIDMQEDEIIEDAQEGNSIDVLKAMREKLQNKNK